MKRLALCGIVFLCLILPFGVSAATFDNVVAFGDSLTDNGNMYTLSIGATPESPPNFYGRYSNGYVWVEYLAYQLGATLDDRAYGGATTGFDNLSPLTGPTTGLNWQVDGYGASVPSNSLVTVWAGANDFFSGRDSADAVDNIVLALNKLSVKGAEAILVPNLPDIGITPAFNGDATLSAGATAWTMAFNTVLDLALDAFAAVYAGDLFRLDVYEIFNEVAADPSAYGFTNITDNSQDTWGLLAQAKACEYVFWDDVHPTTKVHALLAEEAYAAVPIPSTMILLASALVGLVGVRRRFMNR